MDTMIITAPSSVIASNFMKNHSTFCNYFTIGRQNCDLNYDFTGDTELHIPICAKYLVHFASAMNASTVDEIINMYNVNIRGTLRMLVAAKEAGIEYIVIISSIFSTINVLSPYYNFYCLTKKNAEEMARLFCEKNGMKLCILRPSQIVGGSKRYSKHQSFFYQIMDYAQKDIDIKIFGNHDPLRNYLYSENMENAIIYAVNHSIEGTWDLIGKMNYHISEIADMIIKEIGSKSKIVFCNEKADLDDNAFYSQCNFFDYFPVEYVELDDAIASIIKTINEHEVI